MLGVLVDLAFKQIVNQPNIGTELKRALLTRNTLFTIILQVLNKLMVSHQRLHNILRIKVCYMHIVTEKE